MSTRQYRKDKISGPKHTWTCKIDLVKRRRRRYSAAAAKMPLSLSLIQHPLLPPERFSATAQSSALFVLLIRSFICCNYFAKPPASQTKVTQTPTNLCHFSQALDAKGLTAQPLFQNYHFHFLSNQSILLNSSSSIEGK